jgi:hypothetical protein
MPEQADPRVLSAAEQYERERAIELANDSIAGFDYIYERQNPPPRIWNENYVARALLKAESNIAALTEHTQEQAAEIERLKLCLEPGKASAIVRSVFDLAEKECGHSPFAAHHGLTSIHSELNRRADEVRRLTEERNAATEQLAAERAATAVLWERVRVRKTPITAPTDDREFIAWCRENCETISDDQEHRFDTLVGMTNDNIWAGLCDIATLRLDLAEARAQVADRQRLFDLVRYCRHKLHDDGLISNKEFSQILTDGSASEPDGGSVKRLESYDQIRAADSPQAPAVIITDEAASRLPGGPA